MRTSLLSFAACSALALAACQADPAPAPAPADATAPAPAPASAVETATPPAPAPSAPAMPSPASDPRSVLAGKVWRVTQRSDEAGVGDTYAFLHDGRLLVGSPNGTPLTGSWTIKDGLLSMTEEGVTHPTGLVVTDADHVRLRHYNPAGVLDITLERAKDVPLPD
ncbi:MAG TPA: hypothetical protein VLC71_03260 [Thermomonas sp.]|nr:hypothetical protein [Thermomonas sp.]